MPRPAIETREQMFHRFVPANIETVSELEFCGNAASGDLQQDGFALDLAGADLSRLQSGTAPLLWGHDVDKVIGRIVSIRATATGLPFRATFPNPGISAHADEKRGLLKNGIINGVSLGFTVEEWEPLIPGRPNAGRKATQWTAYEISLCAIPVDVKGVVTARAQKKGASMKSKMAALDTATDETKAAARHHAALAEHLDRLAGHRTAAASALRAHKAALEAGDTETAIECQARCQRAVTGMGRELRGIGDRHADALDAHANLLRAMRTVDDAFDSDSQEIQTSAGTGDDEGSRARRQAELRRLARPPISTEHARRLRDLELLQAAGKNF